MPFNIEWVARELERKYGKDISIFEWPFAVDHIVDLLDDVEDYWERGKGAQGKKDTLYHNLAVWGFEVADAYNISSDMCARAIKNPKDEWFRPPSEPRLRTAYKVLNPAQLTQRSNDTQIEVAKKIKARDGEIGNRGTSMVSIVKKKI